MRRGESRRHLRSGILIPIGILIILALAVIGCLRLRSLILDAAADAGLARTELLSGAAIVKAGGLSLTAAQAAEATRQFQLAQDHSADVKATLSRSLWIRMASFVPWVRTQVQAGQELSDIEIHIARGGQLLVKASSNAQAALPHTGGGAPGEKALETLDALDPQLRMISSELSAALADRQRIHPSELIPQLASAVRQFDNKANLAQLKSALSTLQSDEPAIRNLLGADGPKTYLVLDQDPAELRGTGGFIGTVGFLSFDHGKMAPFDPVNVKAIDKLPDGNTDVLGGPGTSSHVDPPYPLAYVFHLKSWELRDSNWSPDFPTAAQEAEFLLNRERGKHVDGVIALNPFLIQQLLVLTGPLKVGDTGDIVTKDNFYQLTLIRRELGTTTQRDTFLPAASKEILNAVFGLPSSKWLSLVQGLQYACTSRELQAYFHAPALESFVNQNRCGGQVAQSPGDSLMIVESNVGGNKDDFWLKREYSMKISRTPNGITQHVLRLHYYGLSSQGVNLTGYWGYTGWLRVYLPSSTAGISVSGARLGTSSELGHLLLEGWFYVQFGHTTDVAISYEEPPDLNPAPNQFHFYWQKQSGRLADPISVDLTLPSGWKLTSAKVGGVASPDGPLITTLETDRSFDFGYSRPD